MSKFERGYLGMTTKEEREDNMCDLWEDLYRVPTRTLRLLLYHMDLYCGGDQSKDSLVHRIYKHIYDNDYSGKFRMKRTRKEE